MHVTREYWATVALAGGLVAIGVVLARPVHIIGATLIGAWLVARQYAFARALADVSDGLSVSQELPHEHVVTERPTPLTAHATVDEPTPLGLAIELGIPATATADGESTLRITTDSSRDETVVDVRWGIAGAFRFDPATIHASDPAGLFEERLTHGSAPTITVEPREPRNVHVGKGGNRLTRAFGEHEADPFEAGLELEEIREYVPGDAARAIDWNSTARFGYPHVREYESETVRQTALVIDHRGTMADGTDGETKLDYARHLVLSFTERIQGGADPLGLYAVDDEGISVRLPPRSADTHYAAVRSHIRDLAATPSEQSVRTGRDLWSRSRTQEIATLSDASTFATRLRPYAGAPSNPQEVEDDPLLSTVRAHVGQLTDETRTIIVSDDTHRAELREAILSARRGGDRVLVAITPTVLFEPDGFADLAAAYTRYSDFERYRRSLDGLDRVSAVELAPDDRLSAVLSAGRRTKGATA